MQIFPRLQALFRRFWSPAFLAYGINGAVAAGSFLSTMLLARMAGPAVIGQYALAIATGNLFVVLAIQGLDRVLLRQIAGDLRVGHSGQARTALRMIVTRVGVAGAVACAVWIGVLLLTPINTRMDGDQQAMLLIGFFVLVTALYRISIAAIRATDSPLLGQMVEAAPTVLLPPVLFVMWLAHVPVTPELAVALVLALNLISGVIGYILLRPHVRGWDAPQVVSGAILFAGFPMMGNMVLQMFNDWFVLAKLSGAASPAEAGAFRVSFQIITIFLTIAATSEAYVAARIAGDFRVGRPDMAWRRHRRARALMGLLSLPVLLLCLIAPHWLLHTAFGPEFAIASTALMIMAVGQVVNIAKGPIGSMLSMAGRDDVQFRLTLAGVLLGVGAAWFLIPRYGLTGGAIAQVLPVVLRGAGSWYFAHRLFPRTPQAG